MASSAPSYILKLGGVGTVDGQYMFTTRDLGQGPLEIPGSLVAPPRVVRQQLVPLAGLASDSGCTVDIIYGPDTAFLLDASLVRWNDSDNVGLRLAKAASASDTTLFISGPAPGDIKGELAWIAGECMYVDDASSTELTVTRAFSGSVATPIPWSQPGTSVMARWPSLLGVTATIDEADVGTRFIGRVRGVSTSAGRITLELSSEMAVLSEQPYELASSEVTGEGQLIRLDDSGWWVASVSPLPTLTLGGAASESYVSTMGWVWLTCALDGGRGRLRVLVQCVAELLSAVTGEVEIGPATSGGNEGLFVALAQFDGKPITLEEFSALSAEGPRFSLDEVEEAFVLAGDSPSALLGAVLTEAGRSSSACLNPSAIGSLAALDDALGSSSRTTPNFLAADIFVIDVEVDKLSELVSALLVGAGCTLSPGRDGLLTVVDIASVSATIEVGDGLRSRLDTTRYVNAMLREVALSSPRVTHDTFRVVSDIASSMQWGGRRAFDVGPWAQPGDWGLLPARWATLTAYLERSIPTAPCTLDANLAVNVGSRIVVASSGLVDGDGLRSGEAVLGVVTEIGASLNEQTVSAALLMVGWGLDLEPRVWAPTGRVAGVAGTTLTLGVAEYAASGNDAAQFVVGQHVYLLDSSGTRLDGNAPAISAQSGATITVAFDVTPTVNDIVVLAPYDVVAEREDAAFLASLPGTLGGDSDPAHTYS